MPGEKALIGPVKNFLIHPQEDGRLLESQDWRNMAGRWVCVGGVCREVMAT